MDAFIFLSRSVTKRVDVKVLDVLNISSTSAEESGGGRKKKERGIEREMGRKEERCIYRKEEERERKTRMGK